MAQPIQNPTDPTERRAGSICLIAGNLARIIKPIPLDYEWIPEDGWLVTAFAGKFAIVQKDLHDAFLTIQEAIEMEFLDLREHSPDRLTAGAVSWLEEMGQYLEEKPHDAT